MACDAAQRCLGMMMLHEHLCNDISQATYCLAQAFLMWHCITQQKLSHCAEGNRHTKTTAIISAAQLGIEPLLSSRP